MTSTLPAGFWTGFASIKLQANGIGHHVVTGGRGPALVLLHGWLGSWYYWRKVMPLLSQQFTIIAPDARGYGDTDKPYAGYDGRTLKEDVRAILRSLGHDRALVIGHDMGALTALLYAAEHPAECAGLVYVDEPLPGYNLDRFTAFDKSNPFVYWWFPFNMQQHLPALLWEGKEDVMVDYMLTAMSANPNANSAEDKAEYVRGLRSPGGLHGSFGWYRDVFKTADQIVESTRTKLKTPVLGLFGQYGVTAGPDELNRVAESVTGEVFPNCGHLIAEEMPVKFAENVLAFATKLHVSQ